MGAPRFGRRDTERTLSVALGQIGNKSDVQLKQDIEAELRWEPSVNDAQIGVTVDHGAVSLLGSVDTYAQKWAAEDATKRVNGVCAVAEDLTVKLLTNHKRTDSDIAMAVENALKWDVFVPKVVTAQVHDGAVSLEGEATWNFERDAAAMAVRRLAGVVSVFNGITLKPQVSATAVKERVQKALERQARTDTSAIKVDASGSTVTLSGNASSFQSTRDAANAAWGAPGVLQVVDRMTVSPTV